MSVDLPPPARGFVILEKDGVEVMYQTRASVAAVAGLPSGLELFQIAIDNVNRSHGKRPGGSQYSGTKSGSVKPRGAVSRLTRHINGRRSGLLR